MKEAFYYKITVKYDGMGYVAYVPAIANCLGWGKTPAKAVKDAIIAARVMVDALGREGKPIPPPDYQK